MSGEGLSAKQENAEEEKLSLLTILPARSSIFSDVNLDDSPRASNVSISRTSAQNIPTPSRPAANANITAGGTSSVGDPAGAGPHPIRLVPIAIPIHAHHSGKTDIFRTDPSTYSQVAIGYTLPAPSRGYAAIRGEEDGEEAEPKPSSLSACWSCVTSSDPLLLATLIGACGGLVGGILLRYAGLSGQGLDLLGFPGELMLRLLKMLVLPLIAGSMVAGVCSLKQSGGSMARIARYTFVYFAGNLAAAVLLGIILVNVLRPGRGQPLSASTGNCVGAPDLDQRLEEGGDTKAVPALMELVRSIVPDNVVAAAVNMNVLGVITFSLFFGACLSSAGEAATPLIAIVQAFNAVISRMVSLALWAAPLGVASLIAAAICRACAPAATAAALGLWMATVLLGLGVYGGLALPLLLYLTTRRAPLPILRQLSGALALAFGTSSSAATLPVTMEAVQELGCSEPTSQFVLPLAATINMTGTALYEATTVIFIAQAHGVELGPLETLIVACTATLAAVGAAAIPSAGLVTMIMVLQAVSLDRFAGDLAVILAVDWLLDRCRTAVNVMGDAFAALIVDHLARFRTADVGGAAYQQVELT
eukprot:jgi/Botrbrau1/6178/Bobra.0344s0018.1